MEYTATETKAVPMIDRLREIAAPILKAYESDLDHDAVMLAEQPDAAYIWRVRESGTDLARLDAMGKAWAEVIFNYRGAEGWYLIDGQKGVYSVAPEEVKHLLKRIPDATFAIENVVHGFRYAGEFKCSDSATDQARLIGERERARVVEINTGKVIYDSHEDVSG